MKFFRLIIVLYCVIVGLITSGYSQEKFWDGFQKDSIVSSLDGVVQRFYYYSSIGAEKKPLVVFLHQWSSDYTSFKNSLAPQAKEKNWNYIHPDFRGPNNQPKACGSKYVIEDIDEAIDWAITHLPVDTSLIYVVGASGGGYAALCSFMKSRHKVKEYSVWVPITDLKRWYFESKSRNSKYADDIVKCTCGKYPEIDLEEAVHRSPLYWEVPVEKLNSCMLKIYAGIHDGYTGAVPIVHSIDFFNKVVISLGGKNGDQVPPGDKNQMLTTQTTPGKISCKIGERDVLYSKMYKKVSLTIFEGGHEILVDEVLKEE
jgi:hypothetical protein